MVSKVKPAGAGDEDGPEEGEAGDQEEVERWCRGLPAHGGDGGVVLNHALVEGGGARGDCRVGASSGLHLVRLELHLCGRETGSGGEGREGGVAVAARSVKGERNGKFAGHEEGEVDEA